MVNLMLLLALDGRVIPARISRERVMPPCFIEGLVDELGRQEARGLARSSETHQLVRICDAAVVWAKLRLDTARFGDDRPDCIAVAALDRGRVCLFGAKALNGQRPRSVN